MELRGGISDDMNTTASIEHNTSVDTNRILREADEFATKYDLIESRDDIRRGVLLFHYPDDYERVAEEMLFLKETDDVPPPRPPIIQPVVCIASYLLVWLSSYNLPEWGWIWTICTTLFWVSSWLQWVFSILSISLGFVLCLALNKHCGRTQTLRIGAILALGLSIWIFFNDSYSMAVVLEVLSATTALLIFSTLLLYLSETIECSKRGSYMVRGHLVSIAIMAMFQITSQITSGKLTRLVVSIFLASIVIGFAGAIPDSPYMLALNGKIPAAYRSLRVFRPTSLLTARDVYSLHNAIANQNNRVGNDLTYLSTSFEQAQPLGRRTWILMASFGLVMFTRGVSSFYVAEICRRNFQNFDINIKISALTITVAFAWAFFQAMIQYLDQLRRRKVLISLFCVMFLFEIPLFFFTPQKGFNTLTIGAASLPFVVTHLLTDVPMALYVSESFPLRHRDIGVGLVVSAYALGTSLVGFQHILIAMIILLPTSVVLIILFTKETRGLYLEQSSV